MKLIKPEALSPKAVIASLSGDYRTDARVHDEMCSTPGVLRPHWQELMNYLDAMGPEELNRRYDRVQGLLQDNGVTYNVYDESRGHQRPWVVDPIPLLMTGEEWASIETGLDQRSC